MRRLPPRRPRAAAAAPALPALVLLLVLALAAALALRAPAARAATAASAAGAAAAADECRGLPVCLPVAGPWVVIPPRAAGQRVSTVVWELRCPLRGYIVAGVDARVSEAAVDVSFRGENGSPVAPGVTTGRSVLFTAAYVGPARKRASFKPFAGCVPTQGGGGRAQTAHTPRTLAAVVPGRPLERVVARARFGAGAARSVRAACRPGDRLVGSAHALGFHTDAVPGASILGLASASSRERGRSAVGRGVASPGLPGGLRIELQVHALCARGGR